MLNLSIPREEGAPLYLKVLEAYALLVLPETELTWCKHDSGLKLLHSVIFGLDKTHTKLLTYGAPYEPTQQGVNKLLIMFLIRQVKVMFSDSMI